MLLIAQAIGEATARNPTQKMAPFTKGLNLVNDDLASHGDDTLPMAYAEQYMRAIRDVVSGNHSNTHAFFESAWQHAKEGNTTGVLLNMMGGFLAGPIDANNRKTATSK